MEEGATMRYRRLYWYVPALDPDSDFYSTNDSGEFDEMEEVARFVVPSHDRRANAVSSATSDDYREPDSIHLPCFDVDVTPNARQMQALVTYFPDINLKRSQTPGHYHAFSEIPHTRKDYFDKLEHLTFRILDCDLIEDGYLRASEVRGATFLRLPNIRKRPKPCENRNQPTDPTITPTTQPGAEEEPW
jgi:hypothetical protein